MKILLLTILSLFLISASCSKKNKKCSQGYDLEHPISVYPIKESYNIGDTIWFEMNFSDVLNALVTNNYTGEKLNENIHLKNFDFRRTFLSFFELVDSSENVAGQSKSVWKESFDPIYVTGNIIQELPDGPEYKLIYQNNSYLLKIGMILKKSGVFLHCPIFLHSYAMADGFLNEQDLTSECETEIITDICFPVNKQLDGSYLTNYHLFEQFMNPSLENDLDRIKKECFTFVVN
jgi:hypothetical protein